MLAHGGNRSDFPMLVDNISRHKASSGFLYPNLRVWDTYQLCVKVSSASDSEICVLEYWTMLFYTFQLKKNGLPIFDKQTKLGMEGLHKLFFPGEDFKGTYFPIRSRSFVLCRRKQICFLCQHGQEIYVACTNQWMLHSFLSQIVTLLWEMPGWWGKFSGGRFATTWKKSKQRRCLPCKYFWTSSRLFSNVHLIVHCGFLLRTLLSSHRPIICPLDICVNQTFQTVIWVILEYPRWYFLPQHGLD